jgi:hypothetical protein
MQDKITVTLRELIRAAYTGAYQRFSRIRKTITAGHRNRRMPAAVGEEVKSYEEQRDAIAKQYGGKPNRLTNDYDWPEDKKEEATVALATLLEQHVDLPGCPIRVEDLLDGGLLEEDYDILKPWIVE